MEMYKQGYILTSTCGYLTQPPIREGSPASSYTGLADAVLSGANYILSLILSPYL